MQKLTAERLYKLEDYAKARADFRAKALAHKKHRQVPVGPNATLYFEDDLTVQYQVQEILRVEKIFEADAIQGEIEAYNPLIPDGTNWKAAFMIEYADEAERRAALATLVNIENQVWVRVADFDRVYAIADEDLDRSTDEKTSAVHFMRWELHSAMISALKNGAGLAVGIDHQNYCYRVDSVPQTTRDALAADLQYGN